MPSVAQKRIPISGTLRKEILERDSHSCQKCGLQGDIAVHHKETVFDGGTNAPDNLISLCSVCHREWHLFFEGSDYIDFDDWLKVPPTRLLVLGWVMGPTGDGSYQEWRDNLLSQWRIGVAAFNKGDLG